MNSKVYYGEYSLQHWINLILSGNITLPEYQRSFVWKESEVKDFIGALKRKEFVPPVILGNFEGKNNYIIDGQQRLTSLFLAYIGKMPKREEFRMSDLQQYADANDMISDDEEADDEPIEWKFSILIHPNKENSIESIRKEIESSSPTKYDDLSEVDISGILENTYLGFSYIIPVVKEKTEQQKFYCSVFRNINMKGTSLLPQESRKSLYFLDDRKKDFFDWKGFSKYKITNDKRKRPIDFIRYVSMASQYAKDENVYVIMRKYSPRVGKDEEYYAIYISEVIGETTTSMFKSFSEIFNNSDYETRLDDFEKVLGQLKLPQEYNSIVDTDITFFGLVYNVLICNKKIDLERADELKEKIKEKIESYNDTSNEDSVKHKRNPNLLKYIRQRWIDSLEIYADFLES